MGLFGKLKDNLDNGGIRIKVDVPGNFKQTDKDFQASIHIMNKSKKSRKIMSIETTFLSSTQEKRGDKAPIRRDAVIYHDVNGEVFDMEAGAEKTLFVVIPLSASNVTDNKALGAAADLAKMAFGVAKNREYRVEVKADVEDIRNDPTGHARVNLL